MREYPIIKDEDAVRFLEKTKRNTQKLINRKKKLKENLHLQELLEEYQEENDAD